MYVDRDLEHAQDILLARLDGLRAAYLIDVEHSQCIDCSFELTHGSLDRDRVGRGVSAAIQVFSDFQPIASIIGSMDALIVRWDDRNLGRTVAVVSYVTRQTCSLVLAGDKIGD